MRVSSAVHARGRCDRADEMPVVPVVTPRTASQPINESVSVTLKSASLLTRRRASTFSALLQYRDPAAILPAMKRVCLILVTGMLASGAVRVSALSEPEVRDAIAFGTTFKSANQFLDDGLKPYKFKIAGVMATDGTSKYVTLLTDWTTIAAASADAHRRLRELTAEEIAKFPNTGLVQVIAEMHARGLIPAGRMQKRYGQGRTHIVLKFANVIVQPLEQQVVADVRSPAYGLWVFTSNTFGNLGWTLVPTGSSEEKIVTNFTFSLPDEQRRSKGKIVLIDGNGSQDDADVDFSKLK